MAYETQPKKIIDLNSLRSRYIIITCILFILLSAAAIFAEFKIQKITETYRQEFSDQFIIENKIDDSLSYSEKIKSSLLEYLILPEDNNLRILKNNISIYEQSIVELSKSTNNINFKNSSSFLKLVTQLSSNTEPLIKTIKNLISTRKNASKTFPFIKIMLKNIKLNNIELLGAVYDASISITSKNQYNIKYIFNEIGHYSTRIEAKFQSLINIRFGIFIDNWKDTYDENKDNINYYNTIIKNNIKKLAIINKQNKLNEISIKALNKIKNIVPKISINYDEAIKKIESNTWRKDILLWKDNVEPSFNISMNIIKKIENELQKNQLTTMHNLNNIPDNLSISIWFIIIIGSIITVIGYLLFDKKVISPIINVTNALTKQSQGKTINIPTHSSTSEIKNLIHSYKKMSREVESSKQTLETLINERTASLEKSNQQLEGTLESLKITKKSRFNADKASEAKTQFIANMSHEIRTPMNVILGYTQIMQHDKNLSESQRTSLNAIKRSGDHLLMLINNVLNISKIESGKSELNPVNFDLRSFLDDLYSMFKARTEGKKINWEININSEKNIIPVFSDAGKLNQVLINLIGNAVKFTDHGSVLLNVEKQDNSDYLFEIIDTGFGIPKESQELIFEKFQQEKNGHLKGGSGLGLCISKTEINEMGGSLRVESTPDKGSKFYFTIKLPDAKLTIKNETEKLKHLPVNIRIKALVVDDILGNRDVLSQLLKLMGIDVIEAKDGESAVALAKEFNPDIVFMDFFMPGINGLQTIEKLRQTMKNGFKAVIVTAHVFDNDIENQKGSNISMVIKKPFNQDEIFNCVSELMSVDLVYVDNNNKKQNDKNNKLSDFFTQGIPHELMQNLLKAIEYCEITEIENISEKIKNLNPEHKPFANKLLDLANNFDTTALQNMVKKSNEN